MGTMKLWIMAGEASGDALGAALIDGLRTLGADVELRGIAGPAMQARGMESLFPMEELSVMGLAEVLPRYLHLRRRLGQAAADAAAFGPDALITIDSPDFALRLAQRVKAATGTRTVHYVAPSVWAWRRGRARRMARYIDQVLALLPFEPEYMVEAGMRCDFVGHPVSSAPVASPAEASAFRARFGLGDAKLVLVLPGSRKSEVARLAPVFGAALSRLAGAAPEARYVIPAAPSVADDVAAAVRDWPVTPVVLDPRQAEDRQGQKRAAFRAADVALAASGTVSLELAANLTPMVIAYDFNWLSWQIISRVVRIDTATLVNLVSGTRAVPEFFGPECRPETIADALAGLLADPGLRERQLEAMDDTMEKLGRGAEPPGIRAARAVLDGLGVAP